MDWWQVVLIILASIIIGILLGYFVSYVIVTRLLKKPFNWKRQSVVIAVNEPLQTAAPDLVAESVKTREARERQVREQTEREEESRRVREAAARALRESQQQAAERVRKEAEEARRLKEAEARAREETLIAGKVVKAIAPELIAEIGSNLRVATEPWSGKLLPFQTGIWDANPDQVNVLPADIRDNLTQAYADIRLANSIVWLATELGRRSTNLDENYQKLCSNVASRLDAVTPWLKRPADSNEPTRG